LARYKESVCKQCRRAGVSLCGSPKCAYIKRQSGPGQHGAARKKLSEYALQLAEKQKVRRMYGLLEKQFRRTYERAVKKPGVTGTVLLQLLETRLDSVLFRSGLVATRAQGRQLINHGHVQVDGQKVDISSYQLKPGQIVSVREKSRAIFKNLRELSPNQPPSPPHWLTVDEENQAIKFALMPSRDDLDLTINEALVIEYYSR
jgi:small subunit ribosomal protein S4